MANASPKSQIQISLDGPLIVKQGTRLMNWLVEIDQWSPIITLRIILLLLRNMIAKEQLFDKSNVSIIHCNDKLEGILNMKTLHVSQIKIAVLRSTIILVQPSRLLQMLISDTPLGNTTHSYAEPIYYTEKITKRNNFNMQDTNGSIKVNIVNSTSLYFVNEAVRNLLNLPSTALTFEFVKEALAHYISANNALRIDHRNPHVLYIKEDLLGSLFEVDLIFIGQIDEFLCRHLTYISEAVLEFEPLSND